MRPIIDYRRIDEYLSKFDDEVGLKISTINKCGPDLTAI